MENRSGDRSSERCVQLAETILEKTTKISAYLENNGLTGPSFQPNAPVTLGLPPDTETSLQEALSAMDELSAMLLGPLGWLKSQIGHAYDLVSLHAMYRYNLPNLFEIGEEASVHDLSVLCNVNEDAISRILQHAVANRLLVQPRPGYVAHTATSAALSRSPPLMHWIGSACEDLWPAACRVIPALEKWPGPPALPNETAFNMAESTNSIFFKALADDASRANRFASSMSLMQSMPGFEPSAALDAYDWASLGPAVVVDVGGSEGTFAIALKERFPALRVTVQDLPEVITAARSRLQATDLNKAANATQCRRLFFRMVLHDWPDESCSKVLRQLIPALRPGAHIILNEFIVPEAGSLPLYQDRQIRCQDLAMLALFKSKERSREQWEGLIESTDSRFKIQSIIKIPNSDLGLIDVVWDC
ncbi:S-adenosyl-L-methionine-dependent methyltransferase [Xylariaceae sp. FL1272]|nr:S-adenosyl-L-methionine-dependent methyltransferase [Xylariaceae sp. FL1272]